MFFLDPSTILYAFVGGMLPALLWLWFFLHEDRLHPEPRLLLIVTFIAGMGTVYLVLPAEQWAYKLFTDTPLLIMWAAIEELFKLLIALTLILWRRSVDEPIDEIIYMVTIALGFAAYETALFLLEPFQGRHFAEGILTGNLRFMGAALLHTLSSGIVGYALAYSYFKPVIQKFFYLCTGLIAAIALHSLFNFFILESNGQKTAIVFFFVWLGIILLFLLFERAKRITRSLPSSK